MIENQAWRGASYGRGCRRGGSRVNPILISLLLTLIVTPVAYSYFDDLGKLFRRAKR